MASATLPRHGQSAQFDHVVGIDTYRDFHVAVALAPNGGRLGELTFTATSKGYEELVAWTEQYGVRPVFAMEGTGSYGAELCRVLLDAADDVIEVNRPDRSARRRQGKAPSGRRGGSQGISGRYGFHRPQARWRSGGDDPPAESGQGL